VLDLDDDTNDREAMNGVLDSTHQLESSARRAKTPTVVNLFYNLFPT